MNNANINEHMNRLIQYIENNLSDDLNTKQLKNIGYVSCAQLYRSFYSLTGHSVKEYVRKRRLSNALALIKTSDFTLTEIALKSGYSSHQGLCRSVKQTLGLTPTEYKNGDIYYFFPPLNDEFLQSISVSVETIPHTLCVMFYHSNLKNIENIAVNIFLQTFPNYNGRIFGRNGEQINGKPCYELYVTDTEKDYTKLNLYGFKIKHEIPCFTNLFASCTVKNDERIINNTWDYLYTNWLQNSMFEYTNDAYYEEYIIKNGKPVKLKLYLPIRKRNENTKIKLINNPNLRFIISSANGYNAEKIASKKIIDYLSEQYPYIAITSKEYYLHKKLYSCICGVRIKAELPITCNENINNITTEQNNYLLLESVVMGDYEKYANILLTFAKNNNIAVDENEIFAIYDVKNSFENPKIKMYLPCKH